MPFIPLERLCNRMGQRREGRKDVQLPVSISAPMGEGSPSLRKVPPRPSARRVSSYLPCRPICTQEIPSD